MGEPKRPNPDSFVTGDLIWPKNPKDRVPYIVNPSLGVSPTFEAERAQWEREREAYRRQGERQLKVQSFDEFRQVYVGHVGMVFLQHGVRMVVEAVVPQVQLISYEEWLAGRQEQWVWHGRLNNEAGDPTVICNKALEQVGKPYYFWGLNLDDDSRFYCSKLIWLSVYRIGRLAMDDDPDPDRSIWYSPKQLMRSPHLSMLYIPGDYGNPDEVHR